jgi:IS605 OrfB family transposase
MYAKYKLQDPSLFVNENQEVMLSIVFNDEIKFNDNKKCLGIDLGIIRLASTSDGKIYKGNDFNTHKRKIRWNKRKVQAKQNHSHSARKKLKMMRRKETNFSKNYIHHLVNEILVTPANTIVIEDLSKIKRKNRGRSFNDRQAQIPYYLLKTILTYKAASLGKKVVSVKPYNTSKEDHRGLDNGKRKGCRYYGVDGVVLDADLNAANNITFRHNKKHSISCSALDGQATVNRLKVGPKLWQTPMALA